MARDIICDVCQVAKATWLEGNLQTGEQTGLCDGCWVAWTLGRLDAELGQEAKAAIAARWGPQGSQPGTEGTGEGSEPKRRRSRPGRSPQDAEGYRVVGSEPIEAQGEVEAGAVEPNRGVAQAPAAADDG